MSTVTMPQLGESVTEGTILQWLKHPGDLVELDEPLCEIETEKVTAELPSPFAGTMGEVHVAEGETVEVGARLCDIIESSSRTREQAEVPAAAQLRSAEPAASDDAEDLEDLPPPSGNGWSGGPMAIPREEASWTGPEPLTPDGPEPRPRVVAVPAAEAAPVAPAAEDRSTFYSPAVVRLASQHGIDLASIRGTGLGGRITRKDVEAAASGAGPGVAAGTQTSTTPSPAAAAARPDERLAHSGPDRRTVVTFSPTRRAIAAHLSKSNLEAPQAWTMIEADVTGLIARRERERGAFEKVGVHLTPFHYFIEAACRALREVPALNARWEGADLVRYDVLHVGVAVAAESGLVVPVLQDAGALSLEGIAKAVNDLAERAHSRRLRVEDVEGGTFTVNNTGAFGSISSKPIVNHPEVGIVTFERAVQRPVVRDNAIAIRWIVNVCLSFDHRALDGLEAGRFLATLKEALEAI